jgi:ABC-type multidrug transport system permease subunit
MFSGTLLNVGDTQANNVIVYYPGGSLYLGQLPPNSPLNFEIPAQWNGKTASVNFIVSYETPLYAVVNTSYSYSYNLTIANSSTTHHTHEPKLFLSVYFYVIIVLIVLIIILIIIRKRRRSNG